MKLFARMARALPRLLPISPCQGLVASLSKLVFTSKGDGESNISFLPSSSCESPKEEDAWFVLTSGIGAMSLWEEAETPCEDRLGTGGKYEGRREKSGEVPSPTYDDCRADKGEHTW